MNFETNWEFIPFKHWWSEQLIYLILLLLCLFLGGLFTVPHMGAKVSYSFAPSGVAPTSRPGATTTPIPSRTPTRTPTKTPTSTPRPAVVIPPAENTPTSTPVPAPAPIQHFSDVSSSSPYYVAVEALFEAGIIKGYQDGRFAPEDIATRNDMALVLYRMFAEYRGNDYGESINYLHDHGFTTRTFANFNESGSSLLRGDAAMFLARILSTSRVENYTRPDNQAIAISYLSSIGLSVGCDTANSGSCWTAELSRGDWANILNVALSKRVNLIQ